MANFTKDNFDYEGYYQEFKDSGRYLDKDDGERGPEAKARIWEDYQKYNPNWRDDSSSSVNPVIAGEQTNIVAGKPENEGDINIADYAGQVATDPTKANLPQLQDQVPTINEQETKQGEVPSTALQGADADKLNQTATQGTAQTVSQVDPRDAVGYDTQTTQENITNNAQANAAQGQVSEGAIIDEEEVPQIDIDETAKGNNELGQALLDFASLDPNDVDPKATVKGQLEELQADFQDADGNPIIPIWAQGIARNVSKIASFSGMSGTAATAAMSTALMEASIPIATSDAQFFQTLTLQNLNNEQQATINRANVLAKFEEINQDSRTAAAIQNAKSFLEMDLANLSNEQQAEIINTQLRAQSILEDAKAVNTERMFEAQSQNEKDMFYDNLNTQIKQYNATQQNAMTQFNVDQVNGMKQFNAQLENQREQYYRDMQYNIDVANANWRQTVTQTNTQMEFEAAAFDVRNMVDISTEMLNQIWDRSDALLDYAWKSSENEAQRQNNLAVAKLQGTMANKAADKAGMGQVLGSIAGAITGDLMKSFSF